MLESAQSHALVPRRATDCVLRPARALGARAGDGRRAQFDPLPPELLPEPPPELPEFDEPGVQGGVPVEAGALGADDGVAGGAGRAAGIGRGAAGQGGGDGRMLAAGDGAAGALTTAGTTAGRSALGVITTGFGIAGLGAAAAGAAGLGAARFATLRATFFLTAFFAVRRVDFFAAPRAARPRFGAAALRFVLPRAVLRLAPPARALTFFLRVAIATPLNLLSLEK
jgi:hypothetical protein